MNNWSKRGLWLLVTLLCIAVAALLAYSLPFFSIVMVSEAALTCCYDGSTVDCTGTGATNAPVAVGSSRQLS